MVSDGVWRLLHVMIPGEQECSSSSLGCGVRTRPRGLLDEAIAQATQSEEVRERKQEGLDYLPEGMTAEPGNYISERLFVLSYM